ncbi:hypothetical protein EZS27_023357 [termite gut metagenome]|uniref:ATPase AAA-type core domain-containing protein n=1 Tax=termite gut metagenome TaxID=433724 RepID=A0A5J4R177_9ZZZZ
MTIDTIKIGGITNIGETILSLDGMSALIAPNNYGKSNVLKAIRFGIDFMGGSTKRKKSQMNFRPVIPINVQLEGSSFSFEIEGSLVWDKNLYNYLYGYSFEWAKTKEHDKGARIVEEHLKLKEEHESKYKSYISRNEALSCYLTSSTGHCSKTLPLMNDQLAINKLNNFDELFYVGVIHILNSLEIAQINTLENPDQYFNLITSDDDINEYSLAFPKNAKIGFFMNSLKKLDPDRYALLKNAVLDLLPNIEDFDPIQVELKKENNETENKLPFRLPDTFYDIQVKEIYNNQYTSIGNISSGCKKILYVLTLTLAAEINKIPLITFEELENSVHSRLLQNLLTTLSVLSGDTKILITSHSPYLVKYLKPNQLKLGLPNSKGTAEFKELKAAKINKLLRLASAEETSLGEYLFDLMLNATEDTGLLDEYFL